MAVQTYPVPPPQPTQIIDSNEVIINPSTSEDIAALLESMGSHIRDPTNSKDTPLGAGENHVGDWIDLKDISHFILLYFSDVDYASISIQFSSDGVNVVSDPLLGTIPLTGNFDGFLYSYVTQLQIPLYRYVRMNVTGGASAQSLFGSHFWLLKEPFAGSFGGLTDSLGAVSLALLTRSVLAGNKLDGLLQPTSSFENVALTQDNAMITASPGTELFAHAIPPEPPLPSGPVATIDPILNTEPHVLDTGWLESPSYPGGQEFNLIADQAGVIAYLLNSHDDQGVHMTNDGAPFISTVAPGVPASLSAAMFGKKYFRLVVQNISGNTVNKMSLISFGNQVPTPSVFNSIDQQKFTFFPAALQQSALLGKVPGTSLLKLMEITTAGFLNTSASDFLREVSLGRVANHEAVTVTARNLSVPTTVFEDIWIVGGTYPYPVTAGTIDVSSSSILDTAAGVGAQEVVLKGLDANYNSIEETIVLNGITPVTTVNSFIRLLTAEVSKVGSSDENLGFIDFDNGIGLIARIAISGARTQLSHYTIPAGKTGLLVYEQATAGLGDDIELDFMVRDFGAGKPFVPQQGIFATEGTFGSQVFISKPIKEKSDIKWRAKKVGLGTADVSIEYRLLLIDNEVI